MTINAKRCRRKSKNKQASRCKSRRHSSETAYNRETPCCNERPVPVLLFMTSNAGDTAYRDVLENYCGTLSRFVGPAKYFVSGDTLQLKDYSKTDWPWTLFDAARKQKRHEEVFPQECEKARALGAELAK